MNYFKYLWSTNLKKLSIKDKLLAITIYNIIPSTIFMLMVWFTSYAIKEPLAYRNLMIIFGFFLGWRLLRLLQIFEYAFKEESSSV